jgi:hypothetical protein
MGIADAALGKEADRAVAPAAAGRYMLFPFKRVIRY